MVLSPYLYRNITELSTFSITKSIGFNLWKGNNPYSNVEGDLKNRLVDEHGRSILNFIDMEKFANRITIEKKFLLLESS